MRQKCQTKQTNLLEISLNLNWTVHLWSADIEKGNICQIFPWSAGQSSVSVNKIPDWIHTKIRDSLLKFIPKFATPVPIYIYTHIYIYIYIYILTIYIYIGRGVTCESQLLFAHPKVRIWGTPKRRRAPLSSPPPTSTRDERPRPVDAVENDWWMGNGWWLG